jgi:hypothetical protein
MCTGYDKYGYDRTGYNKYGYDNKGYDKYGYSKDGECFVQFCSGQVFSTAAVLPIWPNCSFCAAVLGGAKMHQKSSS